MVKTILRIIILLVISWLMLLGYWHFFPNQETRIRRMLGELARVAAVSPNSTPLANLAAANELAGFFTKEIEISVDVPGAGRHTFTGREEIIQAVVGTRSHYPGMKVELFDIAVKLAAGGQSATVDLTAKVTQTAERDFGVQELTFQLKKTDGDWRITRVDTVRTLGS